MGQYHKILNLTRKEFLNPQAFGDGLKLLEFGASGDGTMCGLAILLACSNGRGGGDLMAEGPLAEAIIGRWVGDYIAIVGDYADKGDMKRTDEDMLYKWTEEQAEGWVDISEHLIEVMKQDVYLKKSLMRPVPHQSRFENDQFIPEE